MQGLDEKRSWDLLPDLADDPSASVAAKVGRRIFNRRLALRMTQMELARRSETEQGNIWAYEAGKNAMRLSTLVKVAAALKTTPSELLEGIQ